MDWKAFFKGKKVTVMGLGLLGRGVGDVAFLARVAGEVIVTDLKSKKELKESIEKLKAFKNVTFTLGKHRLKDFENRDFIIKAAGVPLDSPFIAHAEHSGVPVYMSTALFAKLSPARIIGITGTRGKTTVTYMLYGILKGAYRGRKAKVYLGGNIQGMATLPLLAKVKKGDLAVLELDSWQLQGFGDLKLSPSLGIFTTFMPDHLNYYKGDLERYFEDKRNIFRFQHEKDLAFAGEQLCSLPSKLTRRLPGKVKFISRLSLPRGTMLQIPGVHNRENAALAFAAARALKVPSAVIKKSLESFRGVPGRLERRVVRKGIAIYNDTTATTPAALKAALEALGGKKNVVLIAGGADKGIDLGELSDAFGKSCKHIALLSGSGTDRLLAEQIIPTSVSSRVHTSLASALRDALRHAAKGDIILLSPGFASFGMFKNEYDRGEQFNALIRKIKRSAAH